MKKVDIIYISGPYLASIIELFQSISTTLQKDIEVATDPLCLVIVGRDCYVEKRHKLEIFLLKIGI